MWRVLYPLRYFRLVNAEKHHIDLWPTIFLAIVIAVPFILLPNTSFFHSGGFLDKLLVLTSALTGFYVAALVAAATFVHPDLDKVFKAGPVALVSRDADGARITEHLTRREFVCTIFGYLAFASFMISLFAALSMGVSDFNHAAVANWPYIGSVIGGKYAVYLRDIGVGLFSLAIAHLAVVTCLGLYYLMDRLYRRDREIVAPKIPIEPPRSDTAA